MSYAWLFDQADPAIQSALDIALGYLQFTNQMRSDGTTEVACARVILDEWLTGGSRHQHPLWLANKAIVAIEIKQAALCSVVRPRN